MRCQSHRTDYGEPPALDEVVESIGALQHASTVERGGRVWGVTATVVGAEPAPEDWGGADGGLGMYQTEPGGAVERRVGCAAGKGRKDAEDALEKHVKKWMVVNEEDSGSCEKENALDCIFNILLGEGNNESFQDACEDDEVKAVDLYFLQIDPERRGRMLILCAKHVKRQDVKHVKQILLNDN